MTSKSGSAEKTRNGTRERNHIFRFVLEPLGPEYKSFYDGIKQDIEQRGIKKPTGGYNPAYQKYWCIKAKSLQTAINSILEPWNFEAISSEEAKKRNLDDRFLDEFYVINYQARRMYRYFLRHRQ